MEKYQGFVAINVDSGEGLNVYNHLKKRPEVVSIYLVAGQYDIMLMAESATSESLADFIIQEVQNTKGVVATMTCMVLRGEKTAFST
ncbi:Lrp/AsnC ligand binding domain-containing protein [bacterium]|nr:Lrp/AsnC ligand binding domain-containing protein [bacterium]